MPNALNSNVSEFPAMCYLSDKKIFRSISHDNRFVKLGVAGGLQVELVALGTESANMSVSSNAERALHQTRLITAAPML